MIHDSLPYRATEAILAEYTATEASLTGNAVSYQSLPGRISIYRSLPGKWKLAKSKRLESNFVGFEDYHIAVHLLNLIHRYIFICGLLLMCSLRQGPKRDYFSRFFILFS